MAKYLTLSGLQTFYAGLKTKLNDKVSKKEGYDLSKNDLTDELKAQYDAAYKFATESGAEKNVIVGVQVNGSAVLVDSETRTVDIAVPTGALSAKDQVAESDLAADLATKISNKVDKVDGSSLITATDLAQIGLNKTAIETLTGASSVAGSVDYKIAQAVASTYQVKGAKAFADLAEAEKVVGYVYNVTDAFTTDATFTEGEGKAYPAGTNVVWSGESWDCLAGTYDLSIYATSTQVATDISSAKTAVVGTGADEKTADTVNGAKAFATDAANTAKTAVVGTAEDTKAASTINGAKAFATDASTTAKTEAIITVVGTASDAETADTVNGAKAKAIALNTAMDERMKKVESATTDIEAITEEEIEEILAS